MEIRSFEAPHLPAMREIWNHVVEAGDAFPQIAPLTEAEAPGFFAGQSFTGVALKEKEVAGLYILHPNNIGRCGHLCNASFAVRRDMRGQGVGESLVRHCMDKGRELGFRVLQFNAVVADNQSAIHLYERLGFVTLGVVPGGFLHKDNTYRDIVLFYHTL